MTATIIHIADLLLWFVIALSVAYVAFFAVVSLFSKGDEAAASATPRHRLLVLIPAYGEDRVIRRTVDCMLQQDYPARLFHVAVISDHMQAATNEWLQGQPVTLFLPQFERSSKAQALQFAMSHTTETYDAVVILDADNTVEPLFLKQLDALLQQGHQAIQCHRTAKNADNSVALLDGASEEINNTLFRKAHNTIGLSSALIGSGMCFRFQWFRANVVKLSTAGEDRELEALLLRQRVHIHYAAAIDVKDEKVSNADNFQRQRLRWMTAQVQSLLSMLPHLPHAFATLNADYIDKTLQQTLIPRALLLLLITFMALLTTLLPHVGALSAVLSPLLCLKWWALLAVLLCSLLIALPSRLRSQALLVGTLRVPQLALRMLRNARHIDTSNHDFIHTTHDK
ncbi:MAG: glycosyltransferase family 2 protein [Prevotella sp.]|nr:glycosyltransferase family 2 protein [Prevotella sp.]